MLSEKLKTHIEQIISSAPIVIVMKGDKFFPKCGFSAKVVDIINNYDVEYETFDILEDEEVRQGIKEYSEWPTFPQLYVNKELIGGCDIITEMHEENELTKLLCQ